MSGYWDSPLSVDSAQADADAWRDAEQAGERLHDALRSIDRAKDITGLRPVRNVVGRPVVQFGTMPPDVARELAELIAIASTRTLYIVRNSPASPGDPGGEE
jgi:hypothetical protein